ncbi:MAG: hypothetical protein JWM25_1967 [Thermoleophilia bacterium]|nr:hypothetical protein [Thermoleophilia bacterium]MCZ4497382.1 hypothetical protein [Thermoleophilia bacterium]
MSYEMALQRVGELRQLAGAGPTGTATDGTAAAKAGAFDAQLTQQQQALMLGGTGTDPAAAATVAAGGDGALAMSEYGIPIVTVEDQYRMLGLPMPSNGGAGGINTLARLNGTTGPAGVTPGSAGVGARMVALAQQELGVAESPSGSNEAPRIKEYRAATAGAENTPGPWCAYFVSYLAQQSGAPIGANGNGTGYVPTLEAWGKQENRFTAHGAGTPQPGDIVIFNWNGGGVPDHTGIVEKVDADGRIHTIEGNSSNKVQRRSYPAGTNDVQGYVRPG